MRRPTRLLFPLALILAAATAGCGSSSTGDGGQITVVATTTQMADFTRAVGGDRVDVVQILPPNADPHDYEPRPSDAVALGEAKLVLRSGGDLDAWLGGLVDSAGSDATVVAGIDSVRTIAGGHEHEEGEGQEHGHGEEEVDPHWWQDPRNAERAVGAVRGALVKADPGGASIYRANAAAYERELRGLDRTVARCIGSLPPSSRKLVTTHDALGYYADRYGLQLVGALIPSLSTQAQPSSKGTRELVEQIRSQKVRAIFPESSINPKLEEAVSRETGAAVGDALWADTLGPEGSAGATYVDSIKSNTRSIVAGLSGRAESCPAR